MNKRLPLIIAGCFSLFASLSCKKAIEKKEQQMVMDAITNGVWIVEQYVEGPNNISNQFLNYTFQFNSNGTVTGKIDSTSTSGTWLGNVSDTTITAQFPSAGDPVKKMNGVWKLKDSGWDYVKAQMTTANGLCQLSLVKK
jgi:hypothetical protein